MTKPKSRELGGGERGRGRGSGEQNLFFFWVSLPLLGAPPPIIYALRFGLARRHSLPPCSLFLFLPQNKTGTTEAHTGEGN